MVRRSIFIAIFLLSALSLLAASACSSKATAGNNNVNVTAKQATIIAQANGGDFSVTVNDIDKYTNTRFIVNSVTDKLSFMAYKYNNQLFVRADICPPCGSESFTLTNGTLVCDRCGTVFDAKTGAGIRGACVKFPKAAVSYEIKDGNVVMKGTDLTTAFKNTLNPKKS